MNGRGQVMSGDPYAPPAQRDDEPGATPEDSTLIELSWTEPEYFAGLFDRHCQVIHRYVACRLGVDLADDIVAETFLTAFRKRAGYDLDRHDARPWLYGIATNLVGEHRRAERRRIKALTRTAVTRTDGERAADSLEDRATARVAAQQLRPRLANVLARLPAADRDLLLLVAWADLTYQEVAQALDIPIGTVRSRLHRVRKKIRGAFGGLELTSEYEESST